MIHITKPMTREEILGRLESLPTLEIFEVAETYVVAYNQQNATDFTIWFAEYFTEKDLEERIHVCPGIPEALQPDAEALAKYLWEVMDHNAFLTLGGLWFVYSDADYRAVARFYESDDAVTLPDYDAEGCMWFSRQACIVDVGRILKKHPHADPAQLRREVIVTALHELRHLMLDTNPALPIEEYPMELGSEFLVERFAQELCEDEQITDIFIKTS